MDLKAGFFVLILLAMVAFVGCPSSQGKGTLQGQVSIGPICPVERMPPDPACQPTQETYDAWPIAVFQGSVKVAQIQPSLNGSYFLELAAGDYTVNLENPGHFGARNLPANVTIRVNENTTLDIDIDTGIR